MRTDRRGFFRALAGALALAGPARADVGEDGPEIHRATSNTSFGARGPRPPRPKGPPAKGYPGRPRVALPAPDAAGGTPLAEVVRGYAPSVGFAPESLSLETTSRLLHLANGVTGRGFGTDLRAAPSAGALYAVEVYLVAERVERLPAGVYSYEVGRHRLVKLPGGARLADVAAALERPAAAEGAAAAVLLSSVFRRYAWRYANRGYRYALVDSGHVGENLRLAARSAGLAETAPLRFHDDALHELLAIDGDREAVCALHLIGRPGPAAAPSSRRALVELVERQDAGPDRAPFLRPAPRRYHAATKLVPAEPGGAPPQPPAPARADAEPGPTLPLRSAPTSATLEESIRVRRSALRLERRPIASAQLGFVLEMARGPASLARAPGVSLYVSVHRVEDVPPGIYRYVPDPPGLVTVRAVDAREALADVCLGQDKVERAAAACLMVARFAPSHSALGDRRYRDQVLEAGAIGQRIYLAAEALGLAARNLAAFVDEDVDALLGLEPGREAVVHLTAFGPGD